MRNFNPSSKDAFSFYENVIESLNSSKKDPEFKERVSLLNSDIEILFKEYNSKFDSDQLESIVANGYGNQEKTDLLNLYKYRRKVLQELKTEITTTEFNRVINTCQNCTINEVNSFDHFLPKGDYPEYSVHPQNLFPSCTYCNGKKSTAWKEGNTRLFLNLYLDRLPDVQYLFVSTEISDNTISARFELENRNNIPIEVFNLIENHYLKLGLLERFAVNIDEVVTSFKTDLDESLVDMSLNNFQQLVHRKNVIKQQKLGINFWKIILENHLVENNDFINFTPPG